MKPVAFDYVAAHSLEEALAALQECGEDAKPIAGGQSLVPALNMRLVRPTLLVDLNCADSTRSRRNVRKSGSSGSAPPSVRRRSRTTRAPTRFCARPFPTSATS